MHFSLFRSSRDHFQHFTAIETHSTNGADEMILSAYWTRKEKKKKTEEKNVRWKNVTIVHFSCSGSEMSD